MQTIAFPPFIYLMVAITPATGQWEFVNTFENSTKPLFTLTKRHAWRPVRKWPLPASIFA